MYTPHNGSLARKVVEFFAANPEETLTRGDVAEKFDVTAEHVDGCLAAAMSHQVIVRRRDSSTGYTVFAAGPSLQACVDALGGKAASDEPTPPNGRTGRRTAIRPLPDIDIDSLQVDYDKPLPCSTNGRGGQNKYGQLLARLDKPGASVTGLPVSYRASLQKATQRYQRENPGVKLCVRTLDSTHIGIWRTA